jgi:hypothetical protein
MSVVVENNKKASPLRVENKQNSVSEESRLRD